MKDDRIRECREAIERCEEQHPVKGIFSDFNKAVVVGTLKDEPTPSVLDGFYDAQLIVERISGIVDNVPVLFPSFPGMNELHKGVKVSVAGEFCSRNTKDINGKTHLKLFLRANTVHVFSDKADTNALYMDGCICKPPVFRTIPAGCEIVDVLLAVDGKNYIPCIAWWGLAREISSYPVGTQIQVYGRVQSREYFKRFNPEVNPDEGEIREAYEVCILGKV